MVRQAGEYMEITTISAEYAVFLESGYTPKVVCNIIRFFISWSFQ